MKHWDLHAGETVTLHSLGFPSYTCRFAFSDEIRVCFRDLDDGGLVEFRKTPTGDLVDLSERGQRVWKIGGPDRLTKWIVDQRQSAGGYYV